MTSDNIKLFCPHCGNNTAAFPTESQLENEQTFTCASCGKTSAWMDFKVASGDTLQEHVRKAAAEAFRDLFK